MPAGYLSCKIRKKNEPADTEVFGDVQGLHKTGIKFQSSCWEEKQISWGRAYGGFGLVDPVQRRARGRQEVLP